jgi:small neutral amino acid transporter SnatA (MarC family)
MLDGVGWIATAVFTISYFSKDPAKLRWIQSVAALFWITYGVMIHSKPVIANIIVAGAAAYSSLRLVKERRTAARQ